MKQNEHPLLKSTKSGINYLIPFILLTTCFALWGFANDVTAPMVKAFSKIFKMSITDGTLVLVAFYGGYFAMALPAALFIKRFSYKAGILLGLTLYAAGALLFIPSKNIGEYYPFLISYFIMTCGLSFLETTANPYVLAMGDRETGTRRLNMAQAFNPIGSISGMVVAMVFIQARMNPATTAERAVMDNDTFNAIKQADLDVLSSPYVAIGLLILFILIMMLIVKMPKGETEEPQGSTNLIPTVKRLFKIKDYRFGVLSQFFYVGAQTMCWTFIIQYGTAIFTQEGMSEKAAEILSQKFNIVALVLFCLSRFICTFLMKYVKPSKLLAAFALVASLLTIGVIFTFNRAGMYMLVMISACMSLMFPTIYAIALGKVNSEDMKLGAAGLIMSILGGSLLPLVQAFIMDKGDFSWISSMNLSFAVPLICFMVIFAYSSTRGGGKSKSLA